MTNLRTAALQALEALKLAIGALSDEDEAESTAVRTSIKDLKAALEQKPKFTLSCGCPSQYGGVPAYWDRDGSTAFGAICEKHWHEYGARSEA